MRTEHAIAERRNRLTEDQRARLQQRIRSRGRSAPSSGIMQVDKRDRVQASSAQQRQWLLWQLAPESSAYHLGGGLRLSGELDVQALSASLDRLIDRHASLRTVFLDDGHGQVDQLILPTAKDFALEHQDLREVDSEEGSQHLDQAIEELVDRPFDLRRGPLLRAALYRLEDNEWRLVIVMHHIISDAQSTAILLQELAAIYQARVSGREADLAQLPVDYIDYAHWQRQWLEKEGDEQFNWWRRELADGSVGSTLPTDHPRGGHEMLQAERHRCLISRTDGARLRQLANSQGCTLFVLLLAAWQLLLSRYSGDDVVQIGLPVANRNRAEVAGVVGFFVNTVVFRTEIRPGISLREFLDQIREKSLSVQANQDIPLERLVDVLKPVRNQGQNPFFQVMFNHLRGNERHQTAWQGLTVEWFDVPERHAQFELTLQTRDMDDRSVELDFIYASELFETGRIGRMAEDYQRVLHAMLEDLDAPVGQIQLLDEAMVRQLKQWGCNPDSFPETMPVHQLIERQTVVCSDRVALVFGDETLSYQQLNQRANQLAHHLIDLGVGPEVRVGIAVERSIGMVVGLLAILKAGGAYVPLDPEYPPERLRYMIEDSGIGLLLTQTSVLRKLPELGLESVPVPSIRPAGNHGAPNGTGAPPLRVLDLDAVDVSRYPVSNPEVAVHGENLAYVIYTSGSTGRPKGVMLRHDGLSSFLDSMRLKPGMGRDDVIVATTSVCFDISILEVFLPLIVGAKLVMAPGEVVRDGLVLTRLVADSGATVLQATPSGWRLLLHAGWHAPKSGRPFKVLCGGEALQQDLADVLLEEGVDLWNMYGPTETTIWSAARTVPSSDQIGVSDPIADTRLYVVDGSLNLLPAGCVGELMIGGVGLARGYRNRASLTAERFVADPFSSEGARLYRTGDLVRWNAEGQLEYLGRIDHQVKVRGFRIEMGEVEAQLLAQPEVREAVVVADEGPGGARLVAYVSAHAESLIDASIVKERLAASLPDYMVPSAIMVLKTLPLNANGKVDKKALLAPAFDTSEAYEPPQGEIEEKLAAIWSEVLGVERVGRQDNFFELGGHSLSASMVISRLRHELETDVPLRKIFETPSLKAFSEAIDYCRKNHAFDETEPVPLRPLTHRGKLALAPIQTRLWMVERLGTQHAAGQVRSAYNMPVALKFNGALNREALKRAIETVVQRHEVLRSSFPEDDDGNPVMVVHDVQGISVPVVDLSNFNESEQKSFVNDLLHEFSAHHFDVASFPLFRLSLLVHDEERHTLLLCVHHLIFDGWSDHVFLKELSLAYKNQVPPEEASLPVLPVQYADYADWHARMLTHHSRKNEGFWKAYLDDAPSLSSLPTDRARDEQTVFPGETIETLIPVDLAGRFKALALKNSASLFEVLMSAFMVVLHQKTGTKDLVVGTDVAGRNHPDIEGLIGFFVNVVPLRSRWRHDYNFVQWLKNFQRDKQSVFEHQEVPFDQIVRYGRIKRIKGATPLVQIIFVMQNTPEESLCFPGLSVEVLELNPRSSKFDIGVFVREGRSGISVKWVYASSLYDKKTLEDFSFEWLEFLRKSVEIPEEKLLLSVC